MEEWDYVQVSFHRERAIKCTRKEHTCYLCHWAIPAGSPARYYARIDSESDTGRIDYGYWCDWRGPCFDPTRRKDHE